MNYRQALIRVFFVLFVFAVCTGASKSADSRQMVKAMESKITFGRYFSSDNPTVLPIRQAADHRELKLCLIWGGPNTQLEGAIGLFGSHGEWLDSVHIPNMVGLARVQYSSYSDDENVSHFVAIKTMDTYGPGSWQQSIHVYAVIDQKLIRVWHGPGDLLQPIAAPWQHRFVTLVWVNNDMSSDDMLIEDLIVLTYKRSEHGERPTVDVQTSTFQFSKEKRQFLHIPSHPKKGS